MKSNRSGSLPRIAACFVAALIATVSGLTARAAESSVSIAISSLSDVSAKHLQLGVGKSVIVDLPEEAGEIYVGDPKIANAIVRSARRVYVSGVANGQTSIFALAKDGRRIATLEVSVGRDVGE
jgi:pilus assembly protein CpaC